MGVWVRVIYYIYISVAHACIEKAFLYRVKTEIDFAYRSHCNCLNLLSWFPGHILIMQACSYILCGLKSIYQCNVANFITSAKFLPPV